MVKLLRYETSAQGTFGIILFKGQSLFVGELPWHNNSPNISCIPAGVYTVRLRNSPKYGRVYHIENVQGRSYVLLHHGNYCGDLFMGWKSNTRGCMLLGLKRGKLGGQKAVLASRIARKRFEAAMGFEPFQLEIRDVT